MRLLVYGINFWPELTGVGKYTGEMCDWLADRGHIIEVVTAPPYYPDWRVAPGYGRGYRRELRGGDGRIRITRCPLWVPRRVTTVRRLLHLGSFAISTLPVLWQALRHRPDALLMIAPTLLGAPAAMAIASMFGVRTWLHVQDFEVDAMFGVTLNGNRGRGRHWALAAEAWLLRSFDHVSSITPKMVERLIAKGVAPARAAHFPNWVDLNSVYPTSRSEVFRREFGIAADAVLVLYSGNIGEKQGLEILILAIKYLNNESNLRFVIAGDGSARERLQRTASGLGRLSWIPLQPAHRLNEMLNAADVHVLPQRADAADLVMPSKLIGMFASGKATVGTAKADTQLGQALVAAGVRVEPGDPVALAESILDLAADSEKRQALGRRARRYAERHFALEAIMVAFEAKILAPR